MEQLGVDSRNPVTTNPCAPPFLAANIKGLKNPESLERVSRRVGLAVLDIKNTENGSD